jgi:hypothetical protein
MQRGLLYIPNTIALHPIILESLVSILIELKRTTKILNQSIIKSKHSITNEFKSALGYSLFSDVTVTFRDIKTFLSLEGSDENHFELKESLILSRFCNLKMIVDRAVRNELAGRVRQ